MIRQLLAHALLFGFWLPPLVAGLWMAGRRQRALNLPLVALGWSLIWVVSLYLLFPPYVPKTPAAYNVNMLLLVACLSTFATVMVLPISVIACWIGTLRGTPAGDKLKFGLSLIIFALIQVLFVAYLIAC